MSRVRAPSLAPIIIKNMNTETLEKIKSAVRRVEENLINGNYEIGGRLNPEVIKTHIGQYGGKVSLSPESIYNSLNPIEIENSNPKAWAVDLDLWIDNKLSDLTVQLTIATAEPDYIGSIEDIHIL